MFISDVLLFLIPYSPKLLSKTHSVCYGYSWYCPVHLILNIPVSYLKIPYATQVSGILGMQGVFWRRHISGREYDAYYGDMMYILKVALLDWWHIFNTVFWCSFYQVTAHRLGIWAVKWLTKLFDNMCWGLWLGVGGVIRKFTSMR